MNMLAINVPPHDSAFCLVWNELGYIKMILSCNVKALRKTIDQFCSYTFVFFSFILILSELLNIKTDHAGLDGFVQK